MLFTLQKTVKSIQRHLHEFLDDLAGGELFDPVTPGAWTHARAKLKHTAFIELNRSCVLPAIYAPARRREIQRWHGHRLLGLDGSLVRLPNSAELCAQFIPVDVTNDGGQVGIRYAEARMSVLYDLLNRVGLDGRLEPSSIGESALALEQLVQAAPGDVAITDRGYTSYRYLASVRALGLHFVARCSCGSFAAVQELFRKDRAGHSVVVKLFAPRDERADLERLGLPLTLKVRFVSLRLPTGELEVLATSLLDEQKYPTGDFLALYHRRWNHETYYGVIKGRLDFENFSGQTPETVRQDFHSALLLCNLESVLTTSTDAALQAESADHAYPKQVNRSVSFHALKVQLLPLLYSDLPVEMVIAKLQQWFAGSPVSVRKSRKVPRKKFSWPRSYHFQRRVKKIVF
ncbi:MAG: IS4 family transposase [Sulfuricaulis sp.]|nr:IS4 family transposase [Sulfuricaulis sp.]